ncbi:MAG: hypothetical protein ACXWC3_23645 [Burkholderiales bacterium]
MHYEEFSGWIDSVATQTRLINQPELLHWNGHKSYLLELAECGLDIVPTVIVQHGDHSGIKSALQRLEAKEFVVKPAVSASGYRTTVFAREYTEPERAYTIACALAEECDVLIQPFCREIFDPGERSLIFLGAKYSHAVWRPPLSRGAAGGESRERIIKSSVDEMAVATEALAALPEEPVYARVDLLPLKCGRIAVAELELIEPALYFGLNGTSADMFIDALLKRIAVQKDTNYASPVSR